MSGSDEGLALEHVCQRLSEKFPQLPAETVRATVFEVAQDLDGPVRDYIPLLVERFSRDRLAATSVLAGPAPSTG
jgi:hypothetical protein